jgi:hypothetical protein
MRSRLELEENARMSPFTPAEAKAFLRDLAKLSEKHGIIIAGCGCCGSPFLATAHGERGAYQPTRVGESFERLKWVSRAAKG